MKQCYFCTNNINKVNYKNVEILKRFLDPFSKIVSRKETGVCSLHQRKLARAIKQSRVLGLIPFVTH